MVRFGGLTAFAIVSALILDIFLSTALMSLLLRRRQAVATAPEGELA